MQKSFTYRNSLIYYKIYGEGMPVVLLHGFGEDGDVWRYQVAFLQKFFKLIVSDLPGTGKSASLSGEDISIEDYADSIDAVLQEEKIDKTFILGHSMGGYITLTYAKKFPQKLLGFGLVHSTAFADSEDKKNTRKKGIEFINKNGSYAFLKNSTPNLFSENFKEHHADEVTQLIKKGRHFEPAALVQYYTAMMHRPDNMDVLKNAQVPVLFIAGEIDSAAPLEDLLKQVNLPNVSHIHILQGVGHMGMWESKEEVNTYILNFVKG